MKRLPIPRFEMVPLVGPCSVAFREFRQRAFTHAWHEHPEAELTWIVRGTGLRHVGDSVEPFGPGDFCLIGPNLPHTWLSGSTGQEGVRSLVLQFDPSRFGAEFRSLPEFARIEALLERAVRGIAFPNADPEAIFQKVGPEGAPMRRLAAVLEVLDSLADSPGSRSLSLSAWGASGPRRPAGDRLSRVMAFIASQTDRRVPQSEAARAAGLTPAAFSRFFRRMVGKTYRDYLCDLQLGRAIRLLIESDLSISEVACASGFDNLSTFNRSFRLKRGIPPRDFRARLAVDRKPI